jgi:two-component system cell cycle sensor histidine kinase/response regulator CckA
MPGKSRQPPAEHLLVAALPVPAVITADGWDKDGATIAFANQEFCNLTGYTPEELVGRNTRILHGKRTDVALLRQGSRAAVIPSQGQGEGWLVRADETEFFARWKYCPLSPAAAIPLLVVYSDHSELWRQREALLDSQKLGTVGLLASGVAHDFNNLMSVINGYCEILAPKIAGVPPAQKDLREVHRAGLKAAAIARQILEFTRRQETEAGVINFNTLIREIADIIRRICGDVIEVELRLASDLGNARFNPVHFQQVLLNLCFNARDSMPNGGRLTLRTFNHAAPRAPQGDVALEVSDSGCGIAAALHEKIFEPFYTTKPSGTGLGLPTAQGLLRQAGGRLTVHSVPSRGATFGVFLPETPEEENTGPTPLGALPATQGTEAILLIENDEGLRKMVAGILAIDGYTVTAAATTAEAVAQPASPQLVIVDTLARGDLEKLRVLEAGNPRLRVVSTATEAPALRAFASGRGAHLPKPFALSSLVAKVRELLDNRGVERP